MALLAFLIMASLVVADEEEEEEEEEVMVEEGMAVVWLVAVAVGTGMVNVLVVTGLGNGVKAMVEEIGFEEEEEEEEQGEEEE